MTRLAHRDKWIELGVGAGLATTAALALWAIGLAELIWIPYFFVGALWGKLTGCVKLVREGVRS